MRYLYSASLTIVLVLIEFTASAQLNSLFAPFDCREHAEWFHHTPEPVVEEIKIDSSLLIAEPTLVIDTIDAWKRWTFVENYAYGKNRGDLPMITDLQALHPYFRDKVTELIAMCKAKGITLAVVETYRTHAKQNEYRGMGRKYTNSAGGRSKHQYGLAVDLVPMKDSVAVWDDIALWKKIGVMGEKLGLRWGGRWKKPYDPGHFEWTAGLTSHHLSSGHSHALQSNTTRYANIENDLKNLKRYWLEWEAAQSSITRK